MLRSVLIAKREPRLFKAVPLCYRFALRKTTPSGAKFLPIRQSLPATYSSLGKTAPAYAGKGKALDQQLQHIGEKIGANLKHEVFLQAKKDTISAAQSIAIARRLAFRFSVEIPKRTVIYFAGRIEGTLEGDITSSNLTSFVNAVDANAKAHGFMQLLHEFSEYMTFLPGAKLKKWLKSVDDPASARRFKLEASFFPKGYFELPCGSQETLLFIDDMMYVMGKNMYNSNYYEDAKTLEAKKREDIAALCHSIGSEELANAFKIKRLSLRRVYEPLTDQEKMSAHYVIAGFLANLAWFRGDQLKAHAPRYSPGADGIHNNGFDAFLHELMEVYSSGDRKTPSARCTRIMRTLAALNEHIMEDKTTIELSLNRHLGRMIEALIIDRCNSEVFANVLADMHLGLDAKSIYDTKSKSWGSVLPIKCGPYHLDESMMLLRNCFNMGSDRAEALTLTKGDAHILWENLQERWEWHGKESDWIPTDAVVRRLGFKRMEDFVATEKLCYDRLAALLSVKEVNRFISVLKEFQQDGKVGPALLRKLHASCGIHVSLVWPFICRLLPYLDGDHLRIKKSAWKMHRDANFSLKVASAGDAFARSPNPKRLNFGGTSSAADLAFQEGSVIEMVEENGMDEDLLPMAGSTRVFLRDLPPCVTEEDIRASMKEIGSVARVNIFGSEYYSTSHQLSRLLRYRTDIKFSNPEKTGVLKLIRKNGETQTYASVDFEDEATKIRALHPTLRIFGVRVSSSVNSLYFPKKSIVKKKRGRRNKMLEGDNSADAAKKLHEDSRPITISSFSQISDAYEYKSLCISKVKMGITRAELLSEIQDLLSERLLMDFTADDNDPGQLMKSGACVLHFQSHDVASMVHDALEEAGGLFGQPITLGWNIPTTEHRGHGGVREFQTGEYATLSTRTAIV